MRNKIAFVIKTINGLYLFRRELVETLAADGDVIILAPNGPRNEYFRQLGCRIIETPINSHGINPISEMKLWFKYKRILKKEKPTIVFTYTIKPNIYVGALCASLGIQYVANITGLGTAVEKKGLFQKVVLSLYRFGLRKAQKVFFQNTESKEFMIKNRIVEQSKCDLIPGSGVNLEYFQLLEYPSAETIDFVFISRIMKEKGIEEYLTSAEYIRNKYQHTRFHVCGGASDEFDQRLKSLHQNGRIIYHGSVPDVRKIHMFSSCTILPSFYPEGISNVLLESAACGRPIITTNRAGCRETVDDGISGFIIKQKDSNDLIEKIEKFLCLTWEQRREMGLRGRSKVEKEFDRKIVIERYLKELPKA